EYNQKLSEDRANSVRDYLIETGGISANRLRAIGYGESMPIAENSNEEGRALNRRTEFKIVQY
ncbi:MAG: OmpA family protein, partial [Chlorobi bacterium]|nr:OmpA family protein [Chlorobiota bacterium]